MSQQSIGIFDSGIGGLTVYKALKDLLPNEHFIYLGDTARVPYGTKSQETVARYSIRNTLFLLEQGVKALVVACNTASAFGLESLVKHFKIPVIGVIDPGAQAAVNVTNSKHIAVIGTEGTISSESYQKAVKGLCSEAVVVGHSASLLVALAEEGIVNGEIVHLVIEKYLSTIKDNPQIDTLILGCTHFPLFKNEIQKYLGNKVQLVDSAIETAKKLQKKLDECGLLNTSKNHKKDLIYSTDAPHRMQSIGCRFLGEPLVEVQKVDISGF